MVSTGSISREAALAILEGPTANADMLQNDLDYLLKKLAITKEEFETIMNAPVRSILDYPNYHHLEIKFRKALNKLRALKILPN